MLIYTAVASLAPLYPYRGGVPPDMLSGGGRQILASYTAYSYNGNFHDVACRLIDTLPHQSPAVIRGRKKLAGPKLRVRKGAGADGAIQFEKVRCTSGDHTVYLLMAMEFAFLCVTDGSPVDEEAFAYLKVVEEAVSSAVAPLGKGRSGAVRKAASHALIQSINTWTSQSNGRGLEAPSGRRSPLASRMTTPPSGHQITSSPDSNGRAALEGCLVEAVRILWVGRKETPSLLHPRGGAESPVEALPTPELRAPTALRPTPRGMLSPGPRSGSTVTDGGTRGDQQKSPPSPKGVPDRGGWGEHAIVNPVVSKSMRNGSLNSAAQHYASSGSVAWGDLGQGSNTGSSTSQVPIFSTFPEPLASSIATQSAGSPSGQMSVSSTRQDRSSSPHMNHVRPSVDAVTNGTGVVAMASGDQLLPTERPGQVSDPLRDQLATRLSLGLTQRQLGLERARSMMQTKSDRWDSLPSPDGRHQPARVSTAPPGQFSTASGLAAQTVTSPLGHISGATSSSPGVYGPHALQSPQQPWNSPNSPPVHVRCSPDSLSERSQQLATTFATVGVGLGQPSAWNHGGAFCTPGGPLDLATVAPLSPPKALRCSSDPPLPPPPAAVAVAAPFVGVNDAREYYANRTTVAEERLRRRRLEGLDQQQHQPWPQQFGAPVDWGTRFGTATATAKSTATCALGEAQNSDDASPSCSGAVGAGATGSRSYHRQSSMSTGKERSLSLGIGSGLGAPTLATSPTSSATSGGVGSPFRQSDRRPQTPPPHGWGHGEGGVSDLRRPSSCSQSPKRGVTTGSGRFTPPSSAARSGRSESVPPRPRSWTGPRSASGALASTSTPPALDAASEGKIPPDAERQKLGLLLPLDYSGMVAEEGTGVGVGDAPLLRELDGMARNALKTQVEVSESEDELLTVLAKFRHTLLSIPLPPPAAVDYEQALKDAQRETIEVNGRLFNGKVEELLSTLRDQVGPLVVGDETLMRTVCQDIVRASSRTSSGGDTYTAMAALLSRPSHGDLLTPSGAESEPIGISVDATKGEVVITVENSFSLRRNAVDIDGNVTPTGNSGGGSGPSSERGTLKERMVRAREQLDDLVEHTAEQFRKMTARKETWGGPGWALDGKNEKSSSGVAESTTTTAATIAAGVPLLGRVEVYLCLLDGSSKRRLKITCPTVEKCPPECILLGAGANEANGTYELAGFRHGSPVYTKGKEDVRIGREFLGGREGWIIGRPPRTVFYGQPVDTLLPPELHWALMNGGSGQNPPPTLMMHNQRRAKERLVDIREMPTPRQHWAIGPNVTFPEDFDHNLVGSAIVARPPSPPSPPLSRSLPPPEPIASSLPIW